MALGKRLREWQPDAFVVALTCRYRPAIGATRRSMDCWGENGVDPFGEKLFASEKTTTFVRTSVWPAACFLMLFAGDFRALAQVERQDHGRLKISKALHLQRLTTGINQCSS